MEIEKDKEMEPVTEYHRKITRGKARRPAP